jgi:ferrous iron transport protein A
MALTEKRILSLGELSEGAQARVHQMQGGQAFLGRMAALGFTTGTPLRLLQNARHGPVIVLIRGTRVALGRGEALKVLVAPEEGGNEEPQP